MVAVWRGLKAMGLVHTEVGETDYKYWSHSLREFDDKELLSGLKMAADHKGYFTLGSFRDLCKPEIVKACHKPFEALPRLKASQETRAKYLSEIHKLFA